MVCKNILKVYRLSRNVNDISNATAVIEAPSCDRCDSNADCVSGLEGENTCVCMTGYTGDGETCTGTLATGYYHLK